MKYIIVRYRAKAEKIPEVKEAIKEFVSEVKKHEKGTLIYDAYQEKDNVSFTYFMCFKDVSSEEIHRNSSYVKKFVSILYPSCEKDPVFIELKKIS